MSKLKKTKSKNQNRKIKIETPKSKNRNRNRFFAKDKFVWLKFDATDTSPDFDRLRKKHGILGLPWILVYEPGGKKRDDLTLTGYEGPEPFAERLNKAL